MRAEKAAQFSGDARAESRPFAGGQVIARRSRVSALVTTAPERKRPSPGGFSCLCVDHGGKVRYLLR